MNLKEGIESERINHFCPDLAIQMKVETNSQSFLILFKETKIKWIVKSLLKEIDLDSFIIWNKLQVGAILGPVQVCAGW